MHKNRLLRQKMTLLTQIYPEFSPFRRLNAHFLPEIRSFSPGLSAGKKRDNFLSDKKLSPSPNSGGIMAGSGDEIYSMGGDFVGCRTGRKVISIY